MAQKKINYDLEGALKAGLTEADISGYLKGKGHADSDISSFFGSKPADFSSVTSGATTTAVPKAEEKGIGERFNEAYKSIFPSYGKEFEKAKTLGPEYANSAYTDTLVKGQDSLTNIASILASFATKNPVAGSMISAGVEGGARKIQGRDPLSISGTDNSLQGAGEDFATQEVLRRLVGRSVGLFSELAKPGSIVGDTLAKIKPTFSGYFDDATRAKRIEETSLTGYNQTQKARIQESVKAEVKRFVETELGTTPSSLALVKHVYDLPVDSVTGDTLSKVINDPVKLQEALTSGSIKFPNGVNFATPNLRQGLAAYNTNEMMTNSAVPNGLGEFVIDGNKLWKEFASPLNKEKFDKLYGAANTQRHQEFFKNIAQVTQPDGSLGTSYLDARIKYGTVGLAGGLLTSIFSGSPTKGMGVAAGLASLYVLGKGGKAGISFLLNNPETARIMAAAAKGGALGMSQEAASRILAREMIGMRVMGVSQDGQEVAGKINSQGQFEADPE